MSPELLDAFQDAMAEVEQTLEQLDQHAPAFIRDCLQVTTDRTRHHRRRPAALSPLAARLLREIADDAYVRAIAIHDQGASS